MKIGITGVHAGCQRSPGLAVAKALQKSKSCDIVALDYDDLSTGLFLPLFSDVAVISWSDDPQELLDEIQKIQPKHNLELLIPCLNNDISPFFEIAPKLRTVGIHTLLPRKSSVNARNKIELLNLARKIGLRYPETVVCSNEEELQTALHQIGCPCVVKGPECGVFPVRSAELFDYYATYCVNSFDFPVLVQEWMEGEEFSVFCLCDHSSEIRLDATVKKFGIADDGETWMSVIVDGSEFKLYMKNLIDTLKWVGPIEVDLLRKGDSTFLLDVNPRFPAWVDGLAETGCNAPLHAAYLAMNLEPPFHQIASAGSVLFKDFEDTCFSVNSMTF